MRTHRPLQPSSQFLVLLAMLGTIALTLPVSSATSHESRQASQHQSHSVSATSEGHKDGSPSTKQGISDSTSTVGDFQSELRFAAATWSIAVGDFNGDGRPDFVSSSSDNTIVVFLGNGDGSFQAPVHYAVNDPLGVAVADLNGDGKLDVVVTDYNSLGTTFGGGVSVLLGNGDGTFQAAVAYNTGKNPTAVAIADLNSDGKPDLVVTDVKSGNVSILLNKGNGTFNIVGQSAAGASPYGVAIADVNRDGRNDVVVTNYCDVTAFGQSAAGCGTGSFSPNTISVLLGNGDGSFEAPVSSAAGNGPFQVAVADLNSDGWPDVVVSDNLGTTLSVLLNKGDGTFLAPVPYVVGHIPLWVVIADYNGDGKPDLAATTRDNALVELLGNGDGTFQPAVNYFSGTEFLGMQNGDFDGNSLPDIVAGTGQFTVGTFLNAGGQSRAQTNIVISPSANPALALTDISVTASVTSAGSLPTGSVTLYLDGIPLIGSDIGILDANGHTNFDLGTFSSGTHVILAIYSGDTSTAGSKSTLLTETVIPRPINLQISSNLNPSIVGETVTLGATLTDTNSPLLIGEITGDVIFSDGTVVLGSSPVTVFRNSATATLDISNLTAGTHPITASYPGDPNFAAGTSAPLIQIVNTAAASLGLAIPPGSSSSATVQAGGTANYNLSIGGAGFAGSVAVVCTIAVTGANCLAPTNVSAAANTASTFPVSVTTTPSVAASLSPLRWFAFWAGISGLFGLAIRTRATGKGQLVTVFAISAMVGAFVLLSGCGGSGSTGQPKNPNSTPAGTYTVNVTASSGGAHESIPLTLVVQ